MRITESVKVRQKKWRDNPIQKRRKRDRWLKQNYGVGIEDYDVLWLRQNGVCAICNQPDVSKNSSGNTKTLSVDHCHVTGKVRGLLCHSCNATLGYAKDNISILENAITYLRKSKDAR